jgi:hypothetical protein
MSDELEAESFADDLSDDQVESSDESLIESFDDEFEEFESVPVERTDEIYSRFKEHFGSDESASLQNIWNDSAVANEAIVSAVVQDHPTIDKIYVEHQRENGGLSLEGIQATAQYLAQTSGFDTVESMGKAHPELESLFWDYYNESTGTISPTGLYRMLAYVGARSGFRYTHKRA